MKTTRIKIRKEKIRCDICKKVNEFIYLSDFSYGQRLIYLNSTAEYAFINLLEDEVFIKYTEMINNIIKNMSAKHTDKIINDFAINTYGITCDMINGNFVDFSINKERCIYCGSEKFERNMVEPELFTEIDVPIITHMRWNKLTESEQKGLLIEKLKESGLI